MIPTLYFLLLAALPQTAPKTGWVEGAVTDATTGAPLSQATVNVRYESAPDGSGQLTSRNERGNTAETGNDGRFRLEVVGGVAFHFAVKRKGYTSVGDEFGYEDPNAHKVEAGKEKTGVVVRLNPESALAGWVFDPELRKPVEGVRISAMTRIRNGASEYWAPRGRTTTDADGRYSIGGLPPGEYRLFLVSNRAPKLVPAPEKKPPEVKDYPALYYPGVEDARSALALNLLPGASLDGLDFKAARQRLYTIRGEVRMDGEPEPLTFFATQPMGEDGGVVRPLGGLPGPGTFELQNLPPGPIKVSISNAKTALAQRKLALLTLSIDSDLEGVRLQLLPGTQATFAISSYGLREGEKDPLWTELKAACTVELAPRARTSWGADAAGKTGTDGRGTLENVFIEPVQVSVRGIPAGWVLREAEYNGQPVEPSWVELNAAAPTHHFRLLLQRAPNAIQGAVRAGNAAAEGALVVAVREPFDKETLRFRQKRATADGDGRYALRTLAPGAWRVLAVDASQPMQAAWRLLLAGEGEKVDVTESGAVSLELEARK
ncbi:MAG: carboxypeptidase regulatory-like domain-containing protein [Acidobacteria bacterium]|nr:carboxypeptidase regulatory-like domain-containing protein [Acidobacteriota bacterium]